MTLFLCKHRITIIRGEESCEQTEGERERELIIKLKYGVYHSYAPLSAAAVNIELHRSSLFVDDNNGYYNLLMFQVVHQAARELIHFTMQSILSCIFPRFLMKHEILRKSVFYILLYSKLYS